jgi:spermidine synthase
VSALPINTSRSRRARMSLLLMLASGFAGLGYQIVWTQQCALWLGHESAGVLAVVAAFFGGLAVGALTLGPRIENSKRPVSWYVACELSIALWSLLLTLIMAPCSGWLLDITGVQPSPLWQWSVAFCGTFLLLLPATAAMGATLPAMERVTAELRIGGRSVAGLYASNTFGAVLGVLACAFWLVPQLGLTYTAAVCIVLNLFCAAISLYLFSSDSKTNTQAAVAGGLSTHTIDSNRAVLMRLALTGLLGIGYEVLVVRVLSQVEEDTVYTFAMLLAVYLVGSAFGAAGYQRWFVKSRAGDDFDRLDNSDRVGDRLLCALAATCIIGTASLWAGEYIKVVVLQLFGTSMTAAIAAEAVLAFIAFAPPTLVMGALFSHLSTRALKSGYSFGLALGVNTLGAATAPLIFGVLIFPLIGAKLALLLIAGGYLALAFTAWNSWRKPMLWLPAGAALVIALLAPPLAFIDIPDGGHVVSYREGVMAAVSVVEDAEGVARLRIDNRQQEGSSSSLRVDGRQALLPILLHPAPQHVLFLGLGTGVTASSAAMDPTLQVDAVELLPEVIAASTYFTQTLNDGATNPRLQLINADARRYTRASDRHYDVIISDNFHPARSGSGSLYTVEHFQAVSKRLASGGLFCQWLPLHQLDLQTLRSIVKSFLIAYPNGRAILASNSLETPVLGLVGGDNQRFDVDALRKHLVAAAQPDKLISFGIDDELAVLGSFVAGPAALQHFSGAASANTDDHPVVAYRAPRITYTPDSLPRDRLIELLRELSIAPDDVIVASSSQVEQSIDVRLAAYWQARNQFIESGRSVRALSDVRSMLAQVRNSLLSVLRISPDFRPAYDPLLLMAASLAQTDMHGARTLLLELIQIQPARPEAELALQRIDSFSAAK